jgi:hypothetical protein
MMKETVQQDNCWIGGVAGFPVKDVDTPDAG